MKSISSHLWALTGRPGSRIDLAFSLPIFSTLFVWRYLRNDFLPGKNSAFPLGWWGWFDQSEYLKSANAFIALNFNPSEHIYPPLYPLLASPFVYITSSDPFFLVDLCSFLIFSCVLIYIGAKLYGRLVAWGSVLVTYIAFRLIAVDQWVIPWTTTLTAALAALIFLGLFLSWRAGWHLRQPKHLVVLAGVCLAYGAIVAVRAVDVIVFLPAMLCFLVLLMKHNRDRALIIAIWLFGAAVFPAAYIIFNEYTSGTVLGTYIERASQNGYSLGELPQKLYSLLFESAPIYLETRQSIADKFWPLSVYIAILFASLLYSNAFVKIIILTLISQYVVYAPYGDLLPTSLFRFLNIHYFKWTFPWIVLICAGELLLIVTACLGRQIRWLAAGAAIYLSLFAFTIVISRISYVSDTRDERTKSVTISFAEPRDFNIVDIGHGPSDFTPVYFGYHRIQLDGITLAAPKDFRMLSAPWGSRIVFMRPAHARTVRVVFGPARLGQLVNAGVGTGQSRVALSQFAFGCRFVTCNGAGDEEWSPAPVVPPPTRAYKFAVDFASGGQQLFRQGWSGAEAWGRWSAEPVATLVVPGQSEPIVGMELDLRPLISETAPRRSAAIRVNNCEVTRTEMIYPEDLMPILAVTIPPGCVEQQKPIVVELSTDSLARPIDIGLGHDMRRLGVGIVGVKLW